MVRKLYSRDRFLPSSLGYLPTPLRFLPYPAKMNKSANPFLSAYFASVLYYFNPILPFPHKRLKADQ
jgi:hypothetical protein